MAKRKDHYILAEHQRQARESNEAGRQIYDSIINSKMHGNTKLTKNLLAQIYRLAQNEMMKVESNREYYELTRDMCMAMNDQIIELSAIRNWALKEIEK